MKNFKVGDKVRISKNSFEYCFKKGDIVEIIGYFDRFFKCEREDGNIQYLTVNCLEPADDVKVIFNGDTTILVKDGKRYVSKCKDGDTLDREKGLLLCLAKSNGINYKDLQEMLAGAEVQNKREAKYKVGDFVEVIDPFIIYDRYEHWFKIYAPNLLEKYKMYEIPYKNKTYRVVAVGKHMGINDMLYAIEDFNKNVYLISESGLKLANVREVKRPVKSGEYVKVVDASDDFANEYENGDILKIVNFGDCHDYKAYYKCDGAKFLYSNEYVVLENYKG